MQNYLNKSIKCECGKVHKTDLKEIEISEHALNKIPSLIKKYGYKKLFLVCDQTTYRVAGQKVEQLLNEAEFETGLFVFQQENIIPDETAIGSILTVIEPECELIIGIGAGTINDLCKFVSFKLKLDYYIVATAPSMDGFASNVSAMITNNLKTTYETHVPKAIIGDLEVLAQAPMAMIAAGVGDILGKYISLLDWKIAHLLQGEYHCSYIENMVKASLESVVHQAKTIQSRDKAAIKAIMEALILSGIAMSYAGNSRPASGSEHHLSHYWEMRFMFDHKAPVLHGTKVGIGTIIVSKLYEKLLHTSIDFVAAKRKAEAFDSEKWQSNIRKVYAQAAQGVIEFEHKVGKNEPSKVIKRIEQLEEKWDDVVALISSQLPASQQIVQLLEDMDAPTQSEAIGVSGQMVKDSIVYAKEIRNRYGLLQILFDLDLIENFSIEII